MPLLQGTFCTEMLLSSIRPEMGVCTYVCNKNTETKSEQSVSTGGKHPLYLWG